MKFQKLPSWNNTKLQATTHLTTYFAISSFLKSTYKSLVSTSSFSMSWSSKKKKKIFLNYPLHKLVKYMCQKLEKLNLRCCKLPCLKVSSIHHLIIESNQRIGYNFLRHKWNWEFWFRSSSPKKKIWFQFQF
jgi:hypothetical protein